MKINNKSFHLLILYITFGHLLNANAQTNIIPQPNTLVFNQESFLIDKNTSLHFDADNQELSALAQYFANHIKHISGYELASNLNSKKNVNFKLIKSDELKEEGYLLKINAKEITISANTKVGLFYGVQSLMQTLPAIRTNESLEVVGMDIKDYPSFSWRGMMLDVSRHFYSVGAIKEVIDLLALYKMNVFHWHLTDNEGWRLEIKGYPKLTSIGAWRTEIPGSIMYKADSTYVQTLSQEPYTYGGYYTQEQAKEIVQYAKERNITVIPEIEMPGHSGAALSAYPQFSCFQHEQEPPNSMLWNGVVDPLKKNLNYCAGNDSSFIFLENVLKEVMEIFPSEYIHIGGDEVDKSYWEACVNCQKRMQAENLKDTKELQSYFIHRMEGFLLKHNKKLLGWDEILEGGLAPSATVMSWRGEDGGIAAAKAGHQVIMTPGNPLYFNRLQASREGEPFGPDFSINSLDKVYQYTPHASAFTEKEKKIILGGQFAIWTEFISSVSHLEYMLLPRMPALAESLWTASENKNYEHFLQKLNQWHFISWEQKGINFHKKEFTSRAHEESRN